MGTPKESAPSLAVAARLRRIADSLGCQQYEVQGAALDLFEEKMDQVVKSLMSEAVKSIVMGGAASPPIIRAEPPSSNGRRHAQRSPKQGRDDKPPTGPFYECPQCQKRLTSARALHGHIGSAHTFPMKDRKRSKNHCPWCEKDLMCWGASFDKHVKKCREEYEEATRP